MPVWAMLLICYLRRVAPGSHAATAPRGGWMTTVSGWQNWAFGQPLASPHP